MKRLTQVMLVMATVMLITATDQAQAQFRGRTKRKTGSVNRSGITQGRRKSGSNFGHANQRRGNRPIHDCSLAVHIPPPQRSPFVPPTFDGRRNPDPMVRLSGKQLDDAAALLPGGRLKTGPDARHCWFR